MKKLVEQFGKHNSDLDKLWFCIKCFLEFVGFLRINELLSVKLKGIQIKETQP